MAKVAMLAMAARGAASMLASEEAAMTELVRSPEREALLGAARDIAPVLEGCAQEGERARRLPRPAVEAMLEGRLFQCATPRVLGGVEADPLTQLEVYEAVATAEGSAGWNLMIGAILTGSVGGRVSDAAANAIFGGERWPIVAGLVWPFGRANVEGEGYRLSGHWRFGSGIHQAAWTASGCTVVEGDEPRRDADGRPLRRLALVPIEAVVVEDTWHVAGLRATGSCDYHIGEYALSPDFVTVPGQTEGRRGGAWWRLPAPAHAMVGHAGFALGVARRCLDEVSALGRKRRYGSPSAQAERESVQLGLGRLMAEYDAARLLAQDATREVWAAGERGEAPESAAVARQRLGAVLATEVAVRCAEFAYRSAGADALFEASPIQRYLRDIMAAQQHVAVADRAYVERGAAAIAAESAPGGPVGVQ